MNKKERYGIEVVLDDGKFIVLDNEELIKIRPRLYYFLFRLLNKLNYYKDGVDLTINLYKPMKQKLADELGITLHRTEQIITECVNIGLLDRLDRGIYAINVKYVIGGGIDEEL